MPRCKAACVRPPTSAGSPCRQPCRRPLRPSGTLVLIPLSPRLSPRLVELLPGQACLLAQRPQHLAAAGAGWAAAGRGWGWLASFRDAPAMSTVPTGGQGRAAAIMVLVHVGRSQGLNPLSARLTDAGLHLHTLSRLGEAVFKPPEPATRTSMRPRRAWGGLMRCVAMHQAGPGGGAGLTPGRSPGPLDILSFF